MSAPNKWILCKDAMPADYGEDWVLVQVRDIAIDFLWIPRIGEYRAFTNSWWLINQDCDTNLGGWPEFEVIAWRPIPKFDLEVEDDSRRQDITIDAEGSSYFCL